VKNSMQNGRRLLGRLLAEQNRLLVGAICAIAIGASADAKAEIIAVHSGSSDPTTEGFIVAACCGSSTVGPISNDLGLNVWSITGLSTASQYGYQSGGLSSEQQAEVESGGFVMTFTARAVQGLAPPYDSVNYITILGADLDNGQRRFEVDLGLDSNGDTVVVLPTSIDSQGPGSTIRSPGPSYTLAGSGSSYHTYQLAYDPTTQLSALSVDGVERLTGYAGHTSFVGNRGLVWASWSGGVGNFAGVDLILGPPTVPGVPTDLLATAGDKQVMLTWSIVSGAATYTVYSVTRSGVRTPIAENVATPSFTVTGLTNYHKYFFEVAASNSAGISAASAEASARPTPGK